MSAADWDIHYENGIPIEMRWNPKPDRPSLRCPRTWPHEAHGPWHTGVIAHPGEATTFDCPGVPLPTKETP